MYNQQRRKWYAALTKPRQEKAAQFYLSNKGVEVFYPKLFIPIASKTSRQIVALFPSYLFVRIDVASSEYFDVAWCRGVKRLVSFGETPSEVDGNVINFLRDRTDSHGLIVARSNLKVGDTVQISNGPFRGLLGIINEPPDTKSRVKVLMSILNRPVQVEVPASSIEIGWVAPNPI